jgi:radical SAM protein with 4Fe4S-binding SPASM domain
MGGATAAVAGTTTRARPKVYSVAIETTAYCNQKCDYCYNEWREDGGSALPGAGRDKLTLRAKKLVEAFEIDHVTLTGGEPFAQPGLFDLLDLLSEHGVGIQIISNGGLVTEALAERLAGYGVRYVQITLNGPDAELHGAHVGRGHFEKTLAGIRALTKHGVSVVGCTVVTKKNAPRLAEILELFLSLGVRHIALSRFSPAGYAARHAAQLLPTRSELCRAFELAEPFGRDRGMHLVCTMPVPPCAVEVEQYPSIQFGTCPIGTRMQEFALGPDGRLKNCTLHKTAIGGVADILDPDLDLTTLLAAPEVTEYRRELPEFCQGCLHASTCGGGCGAAAEWVIGHARKYPDPFVWQHIDDDLAARFERDRQGKTHLEVIL